MTLLTYRGRNPAPLSSKKTFLKLFIILGIYNFACSVQLLASSMVLLFSGTVFKVASGGGPSIELSEVPKPVISTLRKAFSSCHYNFFSCGFILFPQLPEKSNFAHRNTFVRSNSIVYLQHVLETRLKCKSCACVKIVVKKD